MRRSKFHAFLFRCFTLICLLAFAVVVEAQQIPDGVRYKKAADEVNKKAKTILEDALGPKAASTDIDSVSGEVIVCGPLLWDALKEYAGKELIGAHPLIVVIGTNPPLTKEGRSVKTSAEKQAFWKLLLEKVRQGNSVSVRKAEAPEIQYYWATIPFDIEEPLYVADFGKQKVLVNFTVKNGEPKIFWMDIVGDLTNLR